MSLITTGRTSIASRCSSRIDRHCFSHGHRQQGYTPFDYFNEFGTLVQAIQNNPNIPNKNMLIGPSLASGPWLPEQVWDTGYLQAYGQYLTAITMEQYVHLFDPYQQFINLHPSHQATPPITALPSLASAPQWIRNQHFPISSTTMPASTS